MSRRRRAKDDSPTDFDGAVEIKTPRARKVPALEPQTDNQEAYMATIQSSTLTFGLGPAGAGKTYVATCMAIDALQKKRIDKIILTRPAQEAGEKLGYLPGELDEKYEPYLRPFRDILLKRLGQGYVECALKNKRIEPLPLAYMRGMTFENCWVLFDEAQNCTPTQMKMFLTRIGENCKVIVNGDLTQQDIPGPSGLYDAVERTRGLAEVGSVEFMPQDVVRSGLVRELIECYSTDPGVRRFMTAGR